MKKTGFRISKMDCPSEEQIVRMKLNDMKEIQSLMFNLSDRSLDVFHSGDYEDILLRLNELNLETSFIRTESVKPVSFNDRYELDTRLLWQVLSINFFFFVFEILAGFISNSMGLIGDSLDMLSDSIVYGLSLYAVTGTLQRKKTIAKISGYFQFILAIFGFAEVLRRFIGSQEIPSFYIMIIVSIFALIGNVISLNLLQKSGNKEAHMQASRIFTSNDVIVNIGVIIAGILVLVTHSKYPDLIVGIIIFVLVGRGAFSILKLSK
jgi:Co/Zn/Cd efflux system component